MSSPDALWQEFFAVAQAIGQRPMTIAEKGLAITQFGLHYRSREVYRTLSSAHGTKVLSGPFAGTDLGQHGEHMSACLARWLGVYEQPLHAAVEAAVANNYDTLVNIGAGEGYYAVGMARRMPALRVIAADTNPDMQKSCVAMAAHNGVAGRIHVQGELSAAALSNAITANTLVICDIEGAEAELLDPVKVPALLNADIIVELHDVYVPGISARLADAYRSTHNIQLIDASAPRTMPALPFIKNLPELEQALLGYEGRAGATPWGVFTRKA